MLRYANALAWSSSTNDWYLLLAILIGVE